MAGSIKGIIVEIGGDTSGLQKALSKVNSATSSLSKELKQVNSLLKLDPKNAELLNQKQDILNQSIATTKDRLKQLQEVKDEADKKMAEGTKINEENYRALQREIIKTQEQLGKLELEADGFYKAGKKAEDFGSKITDISKKVNDLGNNLTTKLTLPIAAVGTLGLTYEAQIEKYEKSFETFLGTAEKANQAIQNIKADAKVTPFDATSLVKANQMLISTGASAEDSRKDILALGEAVVATGGGNDELVRMASNLQQIKNAGKATAMDIRQFAYAGIDVYGILAEYTGKTTQEVKNMEISYEDLTGALKKASSQGGKYFGAMDKSSQTLTGQLSALKSEVQEGIGDLTKSLMPVAKKVVEKARDIIKQLDNLSDAEKENIVKIGLMVAAAGPLLKIVSTLGKTIGIAAKGIGTFTQAIGVMKTGVETSSATVNNLAKILKGLTSPAGLAAAGITAAVAIIIAKTKEAEKQLENTFETIGNSAKSFNDGIESATGYLDSFNSTMFASAEEQERLQQEMDEIQEGITKICKTASDERRGYTQEEITQLDEYFDRLRKLKNREIEIQNQIAGAITQQAKTTAENFKGSLQEYKTESQEWIKTAKEQSDKTVKLIQDGTIEEIALLNQRYGEEANMQNEAYATEYNKIIEQRDKKIEAAKSEIGEITSAFADGYLERAKQTGEFYDHMEYYNWLSEEEERRHTNNISSIRDNWLLTDANKAESYADERYRHNEEMKKIWKQMYTNMSDSQKEQLGTWMAMLVDAEMYGKEITDEDRKMIDLVLESFNEMPDSAKNVMKDTMQGMINGMKDKEPVLYAQASGVANSVLGRLKKAFDINSPSRKTRDIFQNVMKRC